MKIVTAAYIVAVGEVKENKGFKKCTVRIETPPLKDEFEQEIRGKEFFDCEVAIGKETVMDLTSLKEVRYLVTATLNLRSFFFKNGKGQEQLGSQLTLKSWRK